MSTYISKIATIVYKNYTENVDMNNEYFKQSELDALIKNDKSIIRVDYYFNGKFVGNKAYTPKQAASQIRKMNITIGNLYNKELAECGPDWYKNKEINERLANKRYQLADKIRSYQPFLTQEAYDDILRCDMCMTWEEFNEDN